MERMMSHTTRKNETTTPDTQEAAVERLEALILLAKEYAAIGPTHDAVFSDVEHELMRMKTALSLHEICT